LTSSNILIKTVRLAWLVSLVTLGIFAAGSVPYQRGLLLQRLASSAEILATSIAEVAVGALVVEDTGAIVDHCMKLVQERPAIKYVVVTKRDGTSLIHTGTGWSRQQLSGVWLPEDERAMVRGIMHADVVDADVYHFTMALAFRGIRWGWVHLGLELETFHSDLRKMYLATLWLALPCVICGFVASYFFARRISLPLQHLQYATERLGAGDLSTRAHISSGDEVEALAESFNRMGAALEHARETDDIIRSMTDGLLVVTADGVIRTVNEGTCRLTGRTEAELVGHPLADVLDTPHDLGTTEGGLMDLEANLRRFDGTTVPVLLSGAKLRSTGETLSGLVCVARDITRLRDSLRDKELLLREVHHRVKNNLQVITSLLRLQSDTVKDARFQTVLDDSRNRIRSMSLVHEKLYRSDDIEYLDFHEYVESLARGLIGSFACADRVKLTLDIEGVHLSIDTAIPCGLVINELVSNALKYAFPDGRSGRIDVAVVHQGEGLYTMSVADDGVGLPEGFDVETTDTLGLKVVHMLVVDQLEGTVSLGDGRGTRFDLVFHEVEYTRRLQA